MLRVKITSTQFALGGNAMKEIAFGLVASLAVGGGVYFAMGSGGYEKSAAQARTKLMMPVPKSKTAPLILVMETRRSK